MFSRVKLLVALVTTIGLCGCDNFLKRQGPPVDEQVVFQGSTMACLKSVPNELGLFLKDELTPERVAENFACLRATLTQFNKFTRGSVIPAQYSSEEIRSFLNEALPKDRPVSIEFMAEIFKLKTVMLGGSDKVMTKAEIEAAHRLLFELESEFVALRGKMKILLFQGPKQTLSSDDLKSAQRQLELSVKNILETSKAEPTHYGFEDIQRLVQLLNVYLNDNSLLGQLLRWLPLAQKFKTLFLGDKTIAYSQKDWQQVLGWTVRGYGSTLEFAYWIKSLDLNQPAEMERLIDFGDSVFDLVEASPELKEKSVLSLKAVDAVLSEVMTQNLLKTNIALPIFQESLRMALTTMIEGPFPQRRSAYEVETMTRKHLATLRYEWNAWALTQRHINQVFKNPKQVVKYPDFARQLNEATGRELVQKRPSLKPGEAPELLQTWSEWVGLMKLKQPMLWNEKERMVIRRDNALTQVGFAGMTKVSLLRTFTRLVMRGYGQGTQKNLWNLTLGPKDFSLFQDDFRLIGQDLHALDARSASPAERTFKEASFFTFSGNGDSILTSTELFEELNILAAAGGMISTDIYNRALKANCGADGFDVFGKSYLETECFRRIFKLEFSDVFSAAPGVMALQMSMFGHVNETSFYDSIWELGAAPYSRAGYTEYSEIRVYATILYYVEILRLLYDTDANMRLSQAEIERAAPRFREFIAEKSPLGKTMADSFFTCLVFEQKKPQMDWNTSRCLLQKYFGFADVGPAELLKVLAVLKADLAGTASFNPQMVLPGQGHHRPVSKE